MSTLREKILEAIVRKSTLKQQIFDNTFSTFNDLKETLFEMASEIDDELDGKLDRRVRIEYRDRGKFEAQLQVASDILIFQMHTDIFEFDANHIIWQNNYVQQNKENSYIGVINIYNFLSDSLKYNLVRPMGFGSRKIDREALVAIIETAINYALNFDLLMPPYEENIRVTVDQFNTKLDNSKFTTGKRLSYDFSIDDI